MFGFKSKSDKSNQDNINELRRRLSELTTEHEAEITALRGDIAVLRARKAELEDEIAQGKLKIAMDDKQLKHELAMKEERMTLENEKKATELEKQHATVLNNLQKEFNDKMEKELRTQYDNIHKVMTEVLGRLPNINAKLRVDA